MLVSHSLGGLYNSYYASRHPKEVKAAVLIDDANACSLAVSVSAKKSPKRSILLAYGVGHYVFVDNPLLAINAIIKQYAA